MTVVSDTSVLLNLCYLGEARLLREICGTVFAPPEVEAEFLRLVGADPRFANLPFPPEVTVRAAVGILPEIAADPDLDAGEKAALALALELSCRLLIDEAAGRRVARLHGVKVTGLLGLLVEARQRGLVAAVAPLLDRLIVGARFWIHPQLRAEILLRAGELP